MRFVLLLVILVIFNGCTNRQAKPVKVMAVPETKDSVKIAKVQELHFRKAGDSVIQNSPNFIFRATYAGKQDSALIILTIKNVSDSLYFFHIAADGLVGNRWITLIEDINALGEIDFAFPKPLKKGRTYTTWVSLQKIKEEFETEKGKISQVQFIMYYYIIQNFFSPYRVLYSKELIVPAKHKHA